MLSSCPFKLFLTEAIYSFLSSFCSSASSGDSPSFFDLWYSSLILAIFYDLITASAMRMPSAAADVIPPA